MSKVISFSISDKYLEKLRTLYPSLTDNLAVKQFVTDRLDGSLDDALDDNLKTIIESSLSSTLDDVLDERLDGQLKTIIETSLDDVLDERLDAVMGKLITSLSERMARLEARLDDNLDGSLDDMERLLRLQREASIASPIPTGEPSRGSSDQPAIKTVTPEVSPSPPDAIGTLPTVETVEPISTIETVASAIEDPEKKIMEPVGGSDSLDTLPVPPITDKTIDQNAIETVPGETDSIEPVTGEGMNPNQAHEYLISKGIEDTSYYYLNKWAKAGVIDTSPQGKNAIKHLILRGKLYFPNPDQP